MANDATKLCHLTQFINFFSIFDFYTGFNKKFCSFLLAFCLVLTSSQVKAINVGDSAVSCPAILKDGSSLNLEEFKGKVIFLDFWATWCPPCKKSMPFLNALHKELLKHGFQVLAINVDEDSRIAKKFLNQYPVNYPVAMDPTGQCPEKYNVLAMPSAYLIDRQGIVRYIHLGFRDGDKNEIRHRILELLAVKK